MAINEWKKIQATTVKPKYIGKLEDTLKNFKTSLDTAYNTLNSGFSVVKTTLETAKTVLQSLQTLGLSPIKDSDDLTTKIFKEMHQIFDQILNLIDFPSVHFLNLFKINEPYYFKDSKKFNFIEWGDFYNQIAFHTLNDVGDVARPIFLDTAKVGAILFVINSPSVYKLYSVYERFKNLFGDFINNPDLERAIETTTNFPIYDRIINAEFLNIPTEDYNKYNDYKNKLGKAQDFYKIEFLGVENNKELLLASLLYPSNNFVDLIKKEDQQMTLKIRFESLTLEFPLPYPVKEAGRPITTMTGKPSIRISPNLTLKLILKNGEETNNVNITLPEGDYGESWSFYIDKFGNLYKDPFLLVPLIKFIPDYKGPSPFSKEAYSKENLWRKVERNVDFDSIPPDYECFRLKDFMPFLDDLYNFIAELKNNFLTIEESILDGLTDIINMWEAYLDMLKTYIDRLNSILQQFQFLTDFLSTEGMYMLYAEGKGVRGMIEAIGSAKNQPPFKKGFFGGAMIVGEAGLIWPIAKNVFGF